jgi:NAD(P)-dependent dehydrogenase (short-subunit alcohol dehydrogenase family)
MKQLLVTILVLLTSIYSFAESDTLQVNTSNLCIEVYTMIPQRYSSRTVNDYSLCLKGDTVVCNLPYMGRTGSDRENANLILFLASDEASYISGQNIQIDGCRRQL